MPAFLMRSETVTVTFAVIEADTEEQAREQMADVERARIRDLAYYQTDPKVSCVDCRDDATPLVGRCTQLARSEMNAL